MHSYFNTLETDNEKITMARIHYNAAFTAETRAGLVPALLNDCAGADLFYSDARAAAIDYGDAVEQYDKTIFTARRFGDTWAAGGVFLEYITISRETFDALRAADLHDGAIYHRARNDDNAEIIAYHAGGISYDGRGLPSWERAPISEYITGAKKCAGQ